MVYTQWLLGRVCSAEWGDGRRMLEEEDEAEWGVKITQAPFRKYFGIAQRN